MEDEEEIEKNQGFSRWSWLAFIDKLACSNPLNYDGVYKLNFISSLNILSYWKERDERDTAILKQKQKQNK